MAAEAAGEKVLELRMLSSEGFWGSCSGGFKRIRTCQAKP